MFLFFSNKNSKRDKIILNEKSKTISDEKDLCRTSSTYFSNIVSDLQIPKIQVDVSDIRSNHDLVLVTINTFQNHPSVVNIKQREFNSIFSFKNTNENEVRKIIKNLNLRKTYQGSDTPTKIIKFNIDLFSSFISQHFKYCISIGEFPNELKHADVIPIHKKRINVTKLIIGQKVYFQIFQTFMRKLFIINFMNTLMINFFLVNVDFARDIVLSSVF